MNNRWTMAGRTLTRLMALPAWLVAKPAEDAAASRETQILLGGQAVIEGVLMRAPHSYCVAVRTPSRGIIDERGVLHPPGERWRGWKWPFLRGLGVLGQTLKLGLKALRFSADAALEEEKKEEQKAKGETAAEGEKKAEFPAWLMWVQVALSVGFFIVLYKLIPLLIARQAKSAGWADDWIVFNAFDGLARLAIFLGFLMLVGMMKDIRRTFQYHGGEHMTVYTWEAQRPVTVENARAFPPEHPRCGTSFLMVVILISLFIYALVPVEGFVRQFAVRIALLPVIVGVSYEVIRAAGRKQGSWFWKAAVWPGMMLQRAITTKQPDDSQIEVAIAALEGALEVERSVTEAGTA